MSLTASIIADVLASYTKAADCGTAAFPPIHANHYTLTEGSGAQQANILWCDERTLAGSASDGLDLRGGLTDIYGAILHFAQVKILLIRADAANGADLTVGSALTSPPTGFSAWLGADGDRIRIAPGGLLLLVAPDAQGFGVTPGTGDLLTIDNLDAGGATYKIMLVGVSA